MLCKRRIWEERKLKERRNCKFPHRIIVFRKRCMAFFNFIIRLRFFKFVLCGLNTFLYYFWIDRGCVYGCVGWCLCICLWEVLFKNGKYNLDTFHYGFIEKYYSRADICIYLLFLAGLFKNISKLYLHICICFMVNLS